ncbi:MAG: site-specific integrase [Thermoplasmata archaeon]|nr:site-specific integrase [Thermoplasmata archaeon]
MPPGATPSAALLVDPDVRRWYDNLARGSRATADVNLRRLAALCASLEITPADLARLEVKPAHDRFLDFVSAEEKRGMAGSYIVRTVKAGKSWLLHNGRKLQRPIRVRGARETPSLKDERVPTQEELRRILLAGTPRIRVACALVAFSGLRPEVLGNYLGNDGLVLQDFPELKLEGRELSFAAIPSWIRVRPELSKNANGYTTFLSAEGCEYLRQYLEKRRRGGEKLGPQTDLIHPDRAAKRFIRTLNIGDAIRTAIRAAGFTWRPFVLRHYFDTQLLTAESKGKVAHDFRIYWMGHVGSVDARYTTNKRQLPKDFVEEMRAAYQRCEPFLGTAAPKQPDVAAELRKALLAVAGLTDQEAAQHLEDTNDEVLALLKKRMMGREAAVDSSSPAGEPNGHHRVQRPVLLVEAETLLAEGWTFVANFGVDRVLLEAP